MKIFCAGDLVMLSDGTYDKVIGFDNGGGAILGRTGTVGYRNVSIIGHVWDKWDYRTDGVQVTLHVQD